MKKFLIGAFVMMLMSLTSVAQRTSTDYFRATSVSLVDSASVVNAQTVSITTPQQVGFWDLIGINVVVTKRTGSPGGVVRLQGSLDGTNFVRLNATDSLNVANAATSSRMFVVSSYPYKYLRLQYISTGTQTSSIRGNIWYKRAYEK